jgi:hypothetical protein
MLEIRERWLAIKLIMMSSGTSKMAGSSLVAMAARPSNK